MQLHKSNYCLALLAGLVSCFQPSDEALEKFSEAKLPAFDVSTVPANKTPDCFAVKMDKWFIAFHYYQGMGDNLLEADRKALKLADEDYRICAAHFKQN